MPYLKRPDLLLEGSPLRRELTPARLLRTMKGSVTTRQELHRSNLNVSVRINKTVGSRHHCPVETRSSRGRERGWIRTRQTILNPHEANANSAHSLHVKFRYGPRRGLRARYLATSLKDKDISEPALRTADHATYMRAGNDPRGVQWTGCNESRDTPPYSSNQGRA